MKNPIRFVLAAILLSSLPASVRAQDRVALVVGNNLYPEDGNFPSLDNCAGDAALIKTTLAALGFRVFHAENATRSEMDTILTDFENAIPRGGTAVFYFAGHGIEFDGKNYLMGSNAKLQARSRLGEEAMDAETFASAMLVAGAKSSFVFLDCCREVPKDVEWLTRGVKKRGLAELNIDGDIIIAYAAKPGQAALDGQDGNSPYAKALAKWLPSGMKHGDLFDQVRLEVHQKTGGAQRTWESGSFLEPFFFKSGAVAGIADLPPAMPEPSSPSRSDGNGPDTLPLNPKVALDRFATSLSAAIKRNPSPATGSTNSAQMLYFITFAKDLLGVNTAGLPTDLATGFEEFRKPLVAIAEVINELPSDVNWDDPAAISALAVDLNTKNPALAQRLASIGTLADQFQTAGTMMDVLASKYGIVLE